MATNPSAAHLAMARLWRRLQSETTYPWGNVRPYAKLERDEKNGFIRISLAKNFDFLTGSQKRAVLYRLNIDGRVDELLTEQEMGYLRDEANQSAWTRGEQSVNEVELVGYMTPNAVFDNDGRCVSYIYNNCERMTLLTEFDHLRLKSYGRDEKRKLTFPLSQRKRNAVTNIFWHTVGRNNPDVFYIAWVPEGGYFELDVRNERTARCKQSLQKFFLAASRQYRYIVVTEGGSFLFERKPDLRHSLKRELSAAK